jgi:hypothetical protein
VVGVLSAFGLDPTAANLKEARAFFRSQDPDQHITNVFRLAKINQCVMTNDVFDPVEAAVWEAGFERDPRFHAALRIDPLLNDWGKTHSYLSSKGFNAAARFDAGAAKESRRFLDEWIARMKPLYLAVSLPPSFRYPDESERSEILREVIFPTCKAHNLPFAMMIGVRKRVNPALGDAGDSLGHADTSTVERICLENPDNRFLVTMLSRENQHELCVAARKFSNLMPFGCWWFLNNPSIVTEITRERIELLGASFIPQHSDARILEQVIYKWNHTRRVLVETLDAAYTELDRDGRTITEEEVNRDVERMFSGNFREWCGVSN